MGQARGRVCAWAQGWALGGAGDQPAVLWAPFFPLLPCDHLELNKDWVSGRNPFPVRV